MTASAALPGGRDLAAWWRDLADWHPRRLWLADLFVHSVEALATVARPARLDHVSLAILRELGAAAGPASIDALHERMSLDRQVLRRVLHELDGAGLAEAGDCGRWKLTPLGRAGLAANDWRAAESRRCTFHFLDNSAFSLPPHFVQFDPPARGQPVAAPPGWSFERLCLRSCVEQPESWKLLFRFPTAVLTVTTAADDWRQVLVDRPERWALVLVETEDGRLLGFCGRGDGHVHNQPVLALSAEASREIFPDLPQQPAAEDWRLAWTGQALGGGLSAVDAERCQIEPGDERLLVRAPAAVLPRWRGRSAWAIAGRGRLRRALPIEVVASA